MEEEAVTAAQNVTKIRHMLVTNWVTLIKSFMKCEETYMRQFDLAVDAQNIEEKAEAILITGAIAARFSEMGKQQIQEFGAVMFEAGPYPCKDEEEYQQVRNYILAKRPKEEVEQE